MENPVWVSQNNPVCTFTPISIFTDTVLHSQGQFYCGMPIYIPPPVLKMCSYNNPTFNFTEIICLFQAVSIFCPSSWIMSPWSRTVKGHRQFNTFVELFPRGVRAPWRLMQVGVKPRRNLLATWWKVAACLHFHYLPVPGQPSMRYSRGLEHPQRLRW